MPVKVPPNSPQMLGGELLRRLIGSKDWKHLSWSESGTMLTEPLVIVGIRGYYKKSMGDPRRNDQGIYDDAIFVYGRDVFASFNANTDPMYPGAAVLNPGVYRSYLLGKHRGKYLALVQRAGEVTVTRTTKGGALYDDTGYFGINIHRGAYSTTGSEGCQTIYPPQWDAFISLVLDQAKRIAGKRWDRLVIPYVLLEN